MSIINKINAEEFTIGTYIVSQKDEGWMLTNDKKGKHEALYFDRDDALRAAILFYTCGQMVAEGTRELLKMVAEEHGLEVA